MDDDKDDKSIIEKALEAVKDIAVVPSEATHEAMEPEPIKPGDEVVVMPMAATGLMGEAVMPLFVIIPRRTNAPKQIFKKIPKTAKKSAKKAAKKSAKKILKEKEGKSSSFQTIRSRRAFEFKSGEKSTGRDLLRYRRHRIASNRSIIKLSLSARGRMGAMKGAYWALGFKGLFSV